MHRIRVMMTTVLTAGLAMIAGCHSPAPPTRVAASESAPPAIHLSNAAPSADALIDAFLSALAANDWNALERLRMTETEYRQFVLPGSVAPGAPPRQYPDAPSEYYWKLLNTKSVYWLRNLLAGYGGHPYTRKAVAYAKGVQDYAWYRAYKRLRLTLEDEHGQAVEVTTGSIAEINGQYKFVSFVSG